MSTSTFDKSIVLCKDAAQILVDELNGSEIPERPVSTILTASDTEIFAWLDRVLSKNSYKSSIPVFTECALCRRNMLVEDTNESCLCEYCKTADYKKVSKYF